MEIAPGIHLLKYPLDDLWTGLVLVRRKKVALIDTAFAPAIPGLLYPYLASLGLRPGDLDFVVNTHCHGDHIGGNARLRAETPAKFCAHRLARAKLRDPYPYLNGIRRRFSRYIPFQEVAAGLGSIELDVVLEDGDLIDLGDSHLRVLHTPGHDTDEISLLDSASGILFSGDTLQGRGTSSSGVAFYQDLGAYRRSVQTVVELLASGAIRTIVAGHPFRPIDGVITGAACAEFLRLCLTTTCEYDAIIREALAERQGEPDLPFLTGRLLERAGLTPKPTVPALVYHTVAAHLEVLAEARR